MQSASINRGLWVKSVRHCESKESEERSEGKEERSVESEERHEESEERCDGSKGEEFEEEKTSVSIMS